MATASGAQIPARKPCYFIALAPELVAHVLSELDSISALGNLITTSRYIHECFARQKDYVVYRVLRNELGPVLTDARFLRVFLPAVTSRGDPDYDAVHTAAGAYRGMLAAGRRGEAVPAPTPAELTELCHTLHQMNLLADAYVTFSGDAWGPAPLSCAERQRVVRAFYRRQIVYNAWAPMRQGESLRWTDQDVAAISNTSAHQGVCLGLFAAFEAWELQQIDHADFFVVRLCAAFRFADHEKEGIDVSGLVARTDDLTRYMGRHPQLTGAALTSLELLPALTSLANDTDAAQEAYHDFVHQNTLLCLRLAWQAYRVHRYPDPARDVYEQPQQNGEERRNEGEEGSSSDAGATIEFAGDAADLPPFGWVDALDGRYANWFGEALFDEPGLDGPALAKDEEWCGKRLDTLRLWTAAGVALWDRRRVEAMKERDWMRDLRTGWVVY